MRMSSPIFCRRGRGRACRTASSLTAAEPGPFSAPADVRRIVELLRSLSRESKLGRTAILVSTDYAYGLMRMLETLVEDVCQLRVFREEQEARAWLNAMSAGNSSK